MILHGAKALLCCCDAPLGLFWGGNAAARYARAIATTYSFRIVNDEITPITFGPLGLGHDAGGQIEAAAVYDGDLYAAGQFDRLRNVTSLTPGVTIQEGIVKWDAVNERWQAVDDTPFSSDKPTVLFVWSGDLLAGSRRGIDAWDGSSWSHFLDLTAESSERVTAMVEFDGDLIAAGLFDMGSLRTNIARWDGSDWIAIDGGLDDWVSDLAVYEDDALVGPMLYAAGRFENANDGGVFPLVPAMRLARYGKQRFTGGSIESVDSIVTLTGDTFPDWIAAGDTLRRGTPPFGVTHTIRNRISDTQIELQASNVNFSSTSDYLIVGEAEAWQDVGDPIDSTWLPGLTLLGAPSLEVHEGRLYLGGDFTTGDDGAPGDYLIRYDGEQWVAVAGGPTDGQVLALHAADGTLHVGGNFTQITTGTSRGITTVSGDSWTRFPGGPRSSIPSFQNGRVFTIVGHDGEIFAGGRFQVVAPPNDTQPLLSLGCGVYTGSAWAPLDQGVGNESGAGTPNVSTITRFGDETIYAGGFPHASNVANTQGIAAFDGFNWRSIADGVDSGTAIETLMLQALAWSDRLVLQGRALDEIDGVSVDHLAAWDGTTWTNIGSADFTDSRSAVVFDGQLAVLAQWFDSTFGSVAEVFLLSSPGSTWVDTGLTPHAADITAFPVRKYAIGVYNNTLYCSARLSPTEFGLFRYDGSSIWTEIARFDEPVRAMIEYGGQLIIAGAFTEQISPSTNPFSGIAGYNGTSFSPLGSGITDAAAAFADPFEYDRPAVWDLAIFGGDLYVAGDFTEVDGDTLAPGLARWDGTNWHAIDQGVVIAGSVVRAIHAVE